MKTTIESITSFNRLLNLNMEFLTLDRKLNLVSCIIATQHVHGDIVECGCNSGTASVLIRFVLDELADTHTHWGMRTSRNFHVYDSFQGEHGRTLKDDGHPGGTIFAEGRLCAAQQELLDTFTRCKLQPPIVHVGPIQNMKAKDFPDKISLAFLDMDLYLPTLTAIGQIWPRLSIGGILIVDDYNYPPTPGINKAVDEFFADKKVTMDTTVKITAMFTK